MNKYNFKDIVLLKSAEHFEAQAWSKSIAKRIGGRCVQIRAVESFGSYVVAIDLGGSRSSNVIIREEDIECRMIKGDQYV